MNTVDLDLERAETQASPEQFLREYSNLEGRLTNHSRLNAFSNRPTASRNSTELTRIRTQRSQHAGTVGARTRSRQSVLPDFGGGKPYPPSLPEQERFVVEFNGPNDPLHPQNWSMAKKYVDYLSIGLFRPIAHMYDSQDRNWYHARIHHIRGCVGKQHLFANDTCHRSKIPRCG